MKRYTTIIAVLVLLALVPVAAMAATGTTPVTITVDYVDQLAVPTATAALTLNTTTPGATAYDQGTVTQSLGLKYSHNSTANKKITATAVANTGNVSNDITLTVTIQGQSSANVVTAGTDQTNVPLWTGITAGGNTKDLIWTANGSLAVTKAGADVNQNYAWTVTFTAADN